jgi:hypothetical protein
MAPTNESRDEKRETHFTVLNCVVATLDPLVAEGRVKSVGKTIGVDTTPLVMALRQLITCRVVASTGKHEPINLVCTELMVKVLHEFGNT